MITKRVTAELLAALARQEFNIRRVEQEKLSLIGPAEAIAVLDAHLAEMRKCAEEIREVLAEQDEKLP